MNGYNKLVIGLDLSEESGKVLDRALGLRNSEEAEVELVHVLEPLTFAYGGDIPMDLSDVQNQMLAQAKKRLAELALERGLSQCQYQVLIGEPATELHRIADEKNSDLIVVGSHGRHGLALLLGSTANAVLHGARCDILAVRV